MRAKEGPNSGDYAKTESVVAGHNAKGHPMGNVGFCPTTGRSCTAGQRLCSEQSSTQPRGWKPGDVENTSLICGDTAGALLMTRRLHCNLGWRNKTVCPILEYAFKQTPQSPIGWLLQDSLVLGCNGLALLQF